LSVRVEQEEVQASGTRESASAQTRQEGERVEIVSFIYYYNQQLI